MLEVIKEGKVIFENGEIVSIEGFHVKGGGAEDLKSYVERRYFCLPEARRVREEDLLATITGLVDALRDIEQIAFNSLYNGQQQGEL